MNNELAPCGCYKMSNGIIYPCPQHIGKKVKGFDDGATSKPSNILRKGTKNHTVNKRRTSSRSLSG